MSLTQTMFNRQLYSKYIGSGTGSLDNAEVRRYQYFGNFTTTRASAVVVVFADGF